MTIQTISVTAPSRYEAYHIPHAPGEVNHDILDQCPALRLLPPFPVSDHSLRHLENRFVQEPQLFEPTGLSKRGILRG